MVAKVLLLLVLLAAAAAVGGQSLEDYYGDPDAPHYQYHYSVLDHYANNFGMQETRDRGRVDGSYYVYLPDGRMQKVYYYVDGESGFVVDLQYQALTHDDRRASREDSHEYDDRR